MKSIAIFASGSGSNAENLITHFRKTQCARVSVVLSNNPEAFVLERAKRLDVPSSCFSRTDFYQSETILAVLNKYEVDYVVLAGFLWLIPSYLIAAFPNRIVNIHPALLPNYGGKGMFGDNVHKAVVANGEKESGITIHYVNEKYDSGNIIFQAKCALAPGETPQSLAEKIHELEYKHFPDVVEGLIRQL
jgi:phosphoribosylglycinamide formyltransferase-1